MQWSIIIDFLEMLEMERLNLHFLYSNNVHINLSIQPHCQHNYMHIVSFNKKEKSFKKMCVFSFSSKEEMALNRSKVITTFTVPFILTPGSGKIKSITSLKAMDRKRSLKYQIGFYYHELSGKIDKLFAKQVANTWKKSEVISTSDLHYLWLLPVDTFSDENVTSNFIKTIQHCRMPIHIFHK